jgi:nucleoporin POM152
MVQQQAGDFAIHSIAHQQKMCTTAIKDLQWAVHPLPYATVGHGKRVIQDIYEGMRCLGALETWIKEA